MKLKLFFLSLVALWAINMNAQKIEVKSMAEAAADLSASVSQRIDPQTGIACALVRVNIQTDNIKFSGNVVGTVERRGLVSYVYMSPDSKKLQLLLDGQSSLTIVFADYGIKQLSSKVTYDLKLVDAVPSGFVIPELTGEKVNFRLGGISFNMIRVALNTDGVIYIGETEVTQELWQAVLGVNPSYFDAPRRPVESVNWQDCQEFIEELNKVTGLKFRLPKVSEWVYAARGGNKSQGFTYAGSNNIDEVGWYYDNSYEVGKNSPDYGTHEVAQKNPNELGLYDMCGNVREWCLDGTNNNQTIFDTTDLEAWRARCDGCWNRPSVQCKLSNQIRKYSLYTGPTSSESSCGLRLALDI